MLDKRLEIGGLQVGAPRTKQNSARFRICDNMYQSLDGYHIPRFGNAPHITDLPTDQVIIAMASFMLKPFFITQSGDNRFHFYYGSNVELPIPPDIPFLVPPNYGDVLSMGIQFIESQDCLFFNFPIIGLYKFDGAQIYRAGVPTPWIYCAEALLGGTTFVRVIQHHLDYQGNIVNSGYLQFPCTPSANNITLRTDVNGLDMMGSYFGSLFPSVSPKGRQDFDNLFNGHDTHFAVYSAATPTVDGVVLTTGGNHRAAVGAYILTTTSYQASYASGFNIETLATAYKVSAVTATTVTLQVADARYLDTNRNWHTDTALSVTLPGTPSGVICNFWHSVWTSNVVTGNYVWKAIIPAPFFSTTAQSTTVNVSSPTVANAGADKNAFNLAGNLGDFYDVTSFKFPFPSFTEEQSSMSFCTYGSLAVIAQTTTIYFSDTSLGGAFEMTSGIAFMVVGGGDDGPVQAIQGTADFMLISRQFKNYYLVGNLPTANYRTQPIAQTSLGVYSNEATYACLDKIIFVNKTGAWALYSGGRCEEISYNARGLFTTFSNTKKYAEEFFWDIDDYPTYVTPTRFREESEVWNKWLRVRFDVSRNLMFLVIPGPEKRGDCLVINMANGELYTWKQINFGTANPDFKDLTFIEGNYYITENGDDGHAIRKEEKVDINYKYDYASGDFPPRLVTTWFTAGEPSYEKKTKQIKMWGNIVGTEINIKQYQDWRPTASNTYVYSNTDIELFSHKKRLESRNALALSVEMVFFRFTRVEIEGLELEFEPFQMEMKR